MWINTVSFSNHCNSPRKLHLILETSRKFCIFLLGISTPIFLKNKYFEVVNYFTVINEKKLLV